MAVEFNKGIGPEKTTDSYGNPAGLYRHPETGKEVGFVDNELGFGRVQADAAVRMGFKYIGPLPEGYEKATAAPFSEAAHQRDSEATDMKGILARLKLLEQENEALKAKGSTSSEVSTPTELDPTTETTEETSTESKQLEDMSLNSRKELETMALGVGVKDPSNLGKYPSKSVLIQAINDQKEQINS